MDKIPPHSQRNHAFILSKNSLGKVALHSLQIRNVSHQMDNQEKEEVRLQACASHQPNLINSALWLFNHNYHLMKSHPSKTETRWLAFHSNQYTNEKVLKKCQGMLHF